MSYRIDTSFISPLKITRLVPTDRSHAVNTAWTGSASCGASSGFLCASARSAKATRSLPGQALEHPVELGLGAEADRLGDGRYRLLTLDEQSAGALDTQPMQQTQQGLSGLAPQPARHLAAAQAELVGGGVQPDRMVQVLMQPGEEPLHTGILGIGSH